MSQEREPRHVSICSGAEAVISFDGEYAIKERVKKSYRIPELDDKIRKQRTNMEASLLDKARRAGINAPLVKKQENSILFLEYIDGQKLKDALNSFEKSKVEEVSAKLGEIIGKLHSAGIAHGDLTTSNFILKGNNLYIIDFGLGKVSKKIEDQATDLHLLCEALKATHFNILDVCWKNILEGYKKSYPDAENVLKRLEEIAKRRRYKTDS